LYLGLLVWCALRALRAGLPPLLGVVIALTMFCLLHYTLRQLIYWLMLVLVLTLSERRVAVGVAEPSRLEPVRVPPARAVRGEI